MRIEVSFENEFSLGRAVDGGYEPVDSSLCFSTIGMTQSQDVIDDLVAALEAQGIVLEQYYAELGHGQHEISTGHAPALQAVDEQIFVRETIRAVASAHGLVASLAPKPWPQNAGNGCHIHFSLWEGDRNRFHDAAGPGSLSAEALAFIAGILDAPARPLRPGRPELQLLPPHHPALLGRRVHVLGPRQPRGAGAGAVALRRPRGGLDERRAEGGRRELQPLPGRRRPDRRGPRRHRARPRAARPGAGRPGTLPADERAAKGIRPLPSSQREALDALAADAVLTGAMGEVLARSYLAVRGSEWDVYSAADEAFEQQGHFQKY